MGVLVVQWLVYMCLSPLSPGFHCNFTQVSREKDPPVVQLSRCSPVVTLDQ